MVKMLKQVPQPCKDLSLYKQEEPTDITLEELLQYRKIPSMRTKDKLYSLIFGITFGIPKVFAALLVGISGGLIFIASCSIWRSFGKPERFRSKLQLMWSAISRGIMFCLGITRITFKGDNSSDARFIVANHVCFFDGWLFVPFSPRLIGKKELLKVPGLKDMCEVFEGIPVDRSRNNGMAMELVRNANDPTKPQIMVLPEGASTSGDYMLRFHLGAFLSDLPVQPATIKYNLWGAPSDSGNVSFFRHSLWHALSFLSVPFITVEIEFLEPLSIKHFDGDPRKFADGVQMSIANRLGVRVLSLGTGAIFKKNAIIVNQ